MDVLKKTDGVMDFSKSASYLARMVRAYNPWPGTFTVWKEKSLKIHRAHAVEIPSPGIGLFTKYEALPAIGTSNGILVIDDIQPAGKKRITGDVFLRGARDWENKN